MYELALRWPYLGVHMNNDIKPFNTQQLQERVSESVRASFGMLIPEEQFDDLVCREIKAYFEEETNVEWSTRKSPAAQGWHTKDLLEAKVRMTPFRFQVWTALNELMQSKIDTVFGVEMQAAVSPIFDGDGTQTMEAYLSDMMDKKLEELAPKMAQAMFAKMFVEAVDVAKADIQMELAQRMHP
jgi:hypothetical protein